MTTNKPEAGISGPKDRKQPSSVKRVQLRVQELLARNRQPKSGWTVATARVKYNPGLDPGDQDRK